MVKIIHAKNIAVIEVGGAPASIDIQQNIEALLTHPDYKDGMSELWDFRQASMVSFDSEELLSLATYVKKHLQRLAKRVAYVVAEDVDFGIGRMWLTYAEIQEAKQERRLFRKIEDAEQWLMSPPDTLE